MQIQFNSDSSIEGRDALFRSIQPDLEKVLARFADHITRVEVHISDVNGEKKTDNDVRALVEARREGKQPTAATNFADTPRQAILGAVDKVKRALESDLGKERDLQRK